MAGTQALRHGCEGNQGTFVCQHHAESALVAMAPGDSEYRCNQHDDQHDEHRHHPAKQRTRRPALAVWSPSSNPKRAR